MENGTADSSSANGLAAAEGGTNAALSRIHTSSRLKSAVHVAHAAEELGDLAKTLGAVAVKEAEVELRGLFHHRGGANTAEYIVSVSRHKVTVGSSFIHEKHGLGKLSEITQNGDFVMIFDSGDSHTYQPKSIYKLRPVSEAQLKKMKASADGKGGVKGGGKKMFNDLQERMELYRTLMSGKSVTIATDATVEEVIAEHATKILGKKEAAKSGAGAEGEKKELAIRQAGVLVNSHRWSTLQYHCHPRLGSVTVLLQARCRLRPPTPPPLPSRPPPPPPRVFPWHPHPRHLNQQQHHLIHHLLCHLLLAPAAGGDVGRDRARHLHVPRRPHVRAAAAARRRGRGGQLPRRPARQEGRRPAGLVPHRP